MGDMADDWGSWQMVWHRGSGAAGRGRARTPRSGSPRGARATSPRRSRASPRSRGSSSPPPTPAEIRAGGLLFFCAGWSRAVTQQIPWPMAWLHTACARRACKATRRERAGRGGAGLRMSGGPVDASICTPAAHRVAHAGIVEDPLHAAEERSEVGAARAVGVAGGRAAALGVGGAVGQVVIPLVVHTDQHLHTRRGYSYSCTRASCTLRGANDAVRCGGEGGARRGR